MEIEDASLARPASEMTDDELAAVLWKQDEGHVRQ